VHHDQLVVRHRLIHYKCEGECGVDLQLFNKTGIIRLSKTETGFESLTCKFITPEVVIPFSLPLTGAVQRDMAPSWYYTNLVVLHSYYTQLEFAGIHGATSYLEPALVDIPEISVKFLYSDQGTKVELENVLNRGKC